MFIAVLFLIAKEEKEVTQWQEKEQIMIQWYNSINKELKFHTSIWITLKNIKLSEGEKEVKEHSLISVIFKNPQNINHSTYCLGIHLY